MLVCFTMLNIVSLQQYLCVFRDVALGGETFQPRGLLPSTFQQGGLLSDLLSLNLDSLWGAGSHSCSRGSLT